MTRLILVTLLLLGLLATSSASAFQSPLLETVYDSQKNLTTVRLPFARISGDRGSYHSLGFSVFYTFAGQEKQVPEKIEFELVSVVKARKLNSDLYVAFVVDGEEMHFGSNRSAIPNPVRGRLWIGERMIFTIPLDQFRRLAGAKELVIKMGGVNFPFSADSLESLQFFSKSLGPQASPPALQAITHASFVSVRANQNRER
jgi:hypothetical protein